MIGNTLYIIYVCVCVCVCVYVCTYIHIYIYISIILESDGIYTYIYENLFGKSNNYFQKSTQHSKTETEPL